MAKQKIQENIHSLSGYELSGKLPDAISLLQNIINEKPDYFDFEIQIEAESGYYGSCSTAINIAASRWETEKEMIDRLKAEKSKKELAELNAIRKREADEQKERAIYESLKRKFEREIDQSSIKPPTE